jgi:hypothetical protein
MSKPKELIPIQKLEALVEVLGAIQKDLDRSTKATLEDNLPGVYMEGWTMMLRSVNEMRKQAAKITGQASRSANLDLSHLALDGESAPKVTKSVAKLTDKRSRSASKD